MTRVSFDTTRPDEECERISKHLLCTFGICLDGKSIKYLLLNKYDQRSSFAREVVELVLRVVCRPKVVPA